MSAEVKILLEGYTNAGSIAETGEEKTRPTITLIRDGDLVVVVDPGILENQQTLVYALQEEGLTIDDVDVVCVTHSHIDHYRNIGMFPNAKILEYFGLWDKDTVQEWSEQFSVNIQVLKTPGHDYTGITLFVTTDDGVVAVCGDIFWWEEYPKNPEDDIYAQDAEKLQESRELVLMMADWIIPGHGKIYKNHRGQAKKIKAGISLIFGKKPFAVCRKCHRKIMNELDSCRCRPYLCCRCCECGLECDLCSCSSRKQSSKHYI